MVGNDADGHLSTDFQRGVRAVAAQTARMCAIFAFIVRASPVRSWTSEEQNSWSRSPPMRGGSDRPSSSRQRARAIAFAW